MQPERREGAAESGVLHATPRQLRIHEIRAIAEDGADFELSAQALGLFWVLGPDRPSQAVAAVIGEPERFLLGIERPDADDRTEAFLLHEPAVLRCVGEDVGGNEVPSVGD